MEKQYHVDILGNYRGTVLYVRMTSSTVHRAVATSLTPTLTKANADYNLLTSDT